MDSRDKSVNSCLELTKLLTISFRALSNSNYGLIIINLEDDKIVFVNNNALRYFNIQWSLVLFESIYSILNLSEGRLYKDIITSFKDESNIDQEYKLELVNEETRCTFTFKKHTTVFNDKEVNLIYGETESPLDVFLNKPVTNSVADPYINSFTRFMFIVTDNYSKFWMFILGMSACLLLTWLGLQLSHQINAHIKSVKTLYTPSNKPILPSGK